MPDIDAISQALVAFAAMLEKHGGTFTLTQDEIEAAIGGALCWRANAEGAITFLVNF